MNPQIDPHKMEVVMFRFGTLFEAATSAMQSANAELSDREHTLFSAGSLMQDVLSDFKIAPSEAKSMAAQVRRVLCDGAAPDDAICCSVCADLDQLLRDYTTPGADDPRLGDTVARLMAAVVDWADAQPTGRLNRKGAAAPGLMAQFGSSPSSQFGQNRSVRVSAQGQVGSHELRELLCSERCRGPV